MTCPKIFTRREEKGLRGEALCLIGKDMREIKLSGREQAVIRSIDYALGSTGTEIQERTQIDGSDLADILNGLCDVGYVESFPVTEPITYLNYAPIRYEVNPSYALQIKEAMKR